METGLWSEGSRGPHRRVVSRQVMRWDLCLSETTLTTVYKSKGDGIWSKRKEIMRTRTKKGRGTQRKGGGIQKMFSSVDILLLMRLNILAYFC